MAKRKRTLSLSKICHALSDPTRVAILNTLATEGTKSCCDFAKLAGKSTLTHHFKVLRDAGIVRSIRRGKYYHSEIDRRVVDSEYPGLLDALLSAVKRELASNL